MNAALVTLPRRVAFRSGCNGPIPFVGRVAGDRPVHSDASVRRFQKSLFFDLEWTPTRIERLKELKGEPSTLSPNSRPEFESDVLASLELRDPATEKLIASVLHLLYKGHSANNVRILASLLQSGRLRPSKIYTTSILSSSSLLASFLRQYYVRNEERDMRRFSGEVVGLVANRSASWLCTVDSTEKLRAMQAQMQGLQKRLTYQEIKARFAASAEADLVATKEQMMLLKEQMDAALLSGTRSVSPAATHSGKKLLGIFVRLSGCQKSEQTKKFEAKQGRFSESSDEIVTDSSITQVNTRTGAYGLRVRIAYSLKRSMPSKSMMLTSTLAQREQHVFRLRPHSAIE